LDGRSAGVALHDGAIRLQQRAVAAISSINGVVFSGSGDGHRGRFPVLDGENVGLQYGARI